MNNSKSILFVFAFFAFVWVSAQDVISVADLEKKIKSNEVTVIWSGDNDGFKAHITGSLNIPHTTLCNDKPVRTVIKPAAEMAKILGSKGVDSSKPIVVYDEGSTKYAGRMYWLLTYLGASDVKMLNGNMKAWKAGRKPISGEVTNAKAATFTAKTNESVLSKIDEVKSAIGNASYVIVDARTPDEFSGKTKEEGLRPGHIPSAVNINHETLLDARGMLKPNAELKTIFEAKGVTSNKTVILYCETSVRAGILFLALKGLGYSKIKVYDGAYLEWQATSTNKVE